MEIILSSKFTFANDSTYCTWHQIRKIYVCVIVSLKNLSVPEISGSALT